MLKIFVVAYKHADGFNELRPITIMTASADRIELKCPITPEHDLKLEGCVTYVGNSSMQVRVDVTTYINNEWLPVVIANLTMVALDKFEHKSVPVHRLEPTNDEERRLMAEGEERRKRRNSVQSMPSDEEMKHIHQIFLHLDTYRSVSENVVKGTNIGEFKTMKSTVNTDLLIMHPQHSSIHNKIMAGFITRSAFELAWVTAYLHSKSRPTFVALDDNTFLNPIDIGSVVNFIAHVVYTKGNRCHVRVTAEVIHPSVGRTDVTNIFHFEFEVDPKQEIVVPETYEDAIMYLEGKRVHEKSEHLESERNRSK